MVYGEIFSDEVGLSHILVIVMIKSPPQICSCPYLFSACFESEFADKLPQSFHAR